jgi:hypothetical protein
MKDETLATIFAMAQQNSMKFACQLTFKQNLYVYFIDIILHLLYLYILRTQSILSKLKLATKMENTAALYEHLVDRGLKFLPFWNLVSTT